MASPPRLLRRKGRRGFRRLVYLSALFALLIVAPGASGLPAALNVDVTVTGTPGLNGWYRGNVTVDWQTNGETGEDPQGCATRTLVVDTLGTKLTCRAWIDIPAGDPIEEEVIKSVTIKIDKTGPTVANAVERQPDANGWYNRPFTVAFAGADATSGLAGCSSSRYAGPDNPSAAVAGLCSDNAGNATPASYIFKYDSTPPTLFGVTARVGNRSAQIAWRKSADTTVVEVFRAPGRQGQGESGIYRGSATGFRDTGLNVGREYEYRVVGVDEASNRAEHKFNLVATGPLLSPTPGAKVKGPTILAWTAVKRASYYNIQLIRNGRRVLSAWPDRPSFRLRRTWLYRGRRYRLRPGVYRWYVWPGFGRISAARYTERPLGSSSFVVTS